MTTTIEGAVAVFPKDPAATLDYSVFWARNLPAGVTITASEWEIEEIEDDEAPLTQVQDTFEAGEAFVQLAGGTAGNRYTASNTITRSDGLIDKRSIAIDARNR